MSSHRIATNNQYDVSETAVLIDSPRKSIGQKLQGSQYTDMKTTRPLPKSNNSLIEQPTKVHTISRAANKST